MWRLHFFNLDLELKNEGFQIDKIINYTSEKIEDLNDENNKIIKNHPPDIIFIYSKRSAESFIEIVKKYSLNGLMTASRVLCISEKVLNVFKKSGMEKIRSFPARRRIRKIERLKVWKYYKILKIYFLMCGTKVYLELIFQK